MGCVKIKKTMGLQIDLHAKLKEYFGFDREPGADNKERPRRKQHVCTDANGGRKIFMLPVTSLNT